MDWLTIISGLLAGLAACIPLCVQLVKTVRTLIQEKRWNALMKIVIDLMEVAEEKLSDGADKKEYVMSLAKTACEEAGCEWNEKVISDLIDAMVAMSKIVNAPKQEEEESPDSEGVA